MMLAKNTLIALFTFILICLSHVTRAEHDQSSLTEQRKEQLTHIVKQDCGSCHGMTLKGGLGPALLPENLEGKPILFLKNTILYGRPGTAMPPWETLLTAEEALWISHQLKRGKITHK